MGKSDSAPIRVYKWAYDLAKLAADLGDVSLTTYASGILGVRSISHIRKILEEQIETANAKLAEVNKIDETVGPFNYSVELSNEAVVTIAQELMKYKKSYWQKGSGRIIPDEDSAAEET